MFGLAHSHATHTLLAMESELARSEDRTTVILYPLALYIADNKRFGRRFIDNFPTDVRNDMACVLDDMHMRSRLDSHGLDPYKILGRLALGGDRRAIAKTLALQTDGYIAEYTTDLNTRVVTRFPHTALAAIQRMTEAQRSRVICYNLDAYYDRKAYDRFLALKPASQAESVLLEDLNRLHKLCKTN